MTDSLDSLPVNETVPLDEDLFIGNNFCSSDLCFTNLGDFCASDECFTSLERLSNETINRMFNQPLSGLNVTEI